MSIQVKTTKTLAPVANPQVHHDLLMFQDAIQEHGYKAYIDRALQCPCRVSVTNAPLSTCQNCNGVGWFFIDRTETILLCTAMANRNKYETWTAENSGTVNIASRAQDKLGYMDRITLLELECWHSQILQMKKVLSLSRWFSFTTYYPITVFDVYKFKQDDEPLERLVIDVDYTVADNKILLDQAKYASETSITLSIRYTHRPSYHVIDISRDLMKQKRAIACKSDTNFQANFPLSCVARRAHYVLDAQNYATDSVRDNTDYNATGIEYENH